MSKKLPKSKRIQIRKQKADIRKTANTKAEADEKIKILLNKVYKE